MRVLMLTSSYPKYRGDTTAPFIESIATHIAAQNVEVHVVLPEHRELRRSPMEEGVYFHPYRYAPRAEWTRWGYAESLRADVKIKRGVYALLPFVMLSSIRTLLALAGQKRFDLIHAHWVLPNAPAAALVARLKHLPLVISLHGSDVFVAEKGRAFGAAARWCFNRAAAMTSCSDDLINRAVALGADEARISLIPYGADTKVFRVSEADTQQVRQRLGLCPDDVMLLAVGRMVYKKGFEFLVAAMPHILQYAPNARLVFVGYGDLRDELERQANTAGLNSHIVFAGKVPRQEIPAYFGASDVVVVPSVRDAAGNVDGLPNVVLEAMAAGKPLIASNIAGFPDVIHDGENGLLVREKDPAALADAVLALARAPALRKQMGDAGRVQIHSKLSWENVARHFIEVYESARGTHANPSPDPHSPVP